jgi:single-strand DNA-binding protein
MNKVTLIGNLVRDLELKTYNGSEKKGSYVRFTLAINDYIYKNNESNAVFINIVAFNKQAERLYKNLNKGDKIAVEGKLRTDSYINSDGEKKYSFEVILERFQLLGEKGEKIS